MLRFQIRNSLQPNGSVSGVPFTVSCRLGARRRVELAPFFVHFDAKFRSFNNDSLNQVWMEDPGYSRALQTLRTTGARIVPIPVDGDGLIVKTGRKLAPRAKLAYVTPANQFPMGVTMSADRRLELLSWATSANAWIIEDEYDAEYRYFGRPLPLCKRSTVPVALSTSEPSRRCSSTRCVSALWSYPSGSLRHSHQPAHSSTSIPLRSIKPSSRSSSPTATSAIISAVCARPMRNVSTFSRRLQTNTSMEYSMSCTQALEYALSAGSKHGSRIAKRRNKRRSSVSK